MTRKNLIKLPLFLLLSSVLLSQLTAQSDEGSRIVPGRSYQGRMRMDDEDLPYRTYRLEVSSDVFAVEVRLDNAPVDLDLYLKHGEPIYDYGEVDHSSSSYDKNESIFVSRLSTPELQDGVYYIDVLYQSGRQDAKRRWMDRSFTFDITVDTITAEDNIRIKPNEVVRSELRPETGMAQTFALRIPEETKAARIDLFDVQGDLDFLVSYENPVPSYSNADYIGDSPLGRESLVMDGSEDEPEIPAGTYYITVFDSVGRIYPQNFALMVSLGADPPEELLEIPRFPRVSDELDQALYSTVEVISESGRGSGVFLSREGILLTAAHVVRGHDGEAVEGAAIAGNLNHREVPRELFHARVLEWDEELDLALLKVESGLYGQELPRNYRFPHLPLSETEELRVGQPLSFIGYPRTGEAASKSSVTLVRGVVSGFAERGAYSLAKTDAPLIPGTSGGAVINAYYELEGIVSHTVGGSQSGSHGSLGFFLPVSQIPSRWLERIKGSGSF